MSEFKRGDTVVLKFDLRDTWNKPVLVENPASFDNKVDILYFDVNQVLHRDRVHKDLLRAMGDYE